MTPEEIRAKVQALIDVGAAPGTRIRINGRPWLEVEIVCHGSDAIMGLDCCLPPRHDGDCYSENKRHHFVPDRICRQCTRPVLVGWVTCGRSACQQKEHVANAERAKRPKRRARAVLKKAGVDHG